MCAPFPRVAADDSRSFDVHTLPERARFVPVSMMHGMLRFGTCPTCGVPPEGASARICIKSNCGLANNAGPRITKG